MANDHSKVTADVIRAAMALAQRDVDLGLITIEQIEDIKRTRFAPVERKKIAEALSAQGMSNRQIAKVTGASPKTIDRDLGAPASNDAESASNDAPPDPQGDVSTVDTRRDTKGRQQPTKKKRRTLDDFEAEKRARAKTAAGDPEPAAIKPETVVEPASHDHNAPELQSEPAVVELRTPSARIDDLDEDIEVEIDPESRRSAFFLRADQAVRLAMYSGRTDPEIVEAAREAAKAWTTLADKLASDLDLEVTPTEEEEEDEEAVEDEADDDDEPVIESPKRKRRPKFIERKETLAEAVSWAFTDLTGLGDEMREAFDNTPESLQQSGVGMAREEAASTLECLSQPDVPAELAEVQVMWSEVSRAPSRHVSRAMRRDDAIAILDACVSVLSETADNESNPQDLRNAASCLRDEIEGAKEEAEYVEFPGMYG
jgi:hypothetical protein